MKKLFAFILLFIPVIVGAQSSGGLINRLDNQRGFAIRQVGSSFHDMKPLLRQVNPQGAKSFNIVMDSMQVYMFRGAISAIHGDMNNLTSGPLNIVFERTHLKLPYDWTSSVCFGINCFAPNYDSNDGSPFVMDSGGGLFVLNLYLPDNYFLGTDSIIDYIKFSVKGGDAGDTLSFILIGIYDPDLGVQDQQPKPIPSTPKITSIYPSPLIQGNAIKVKVSSPRQSNLSYSIYDALGRVVALGSTRQQINLGDNTVEINSLDGLSNGNYMVKFTFIDGKSDTRFFQVIR